MKKIRFLWASIAFLVLIITLYSYDGLTNSDIWIFLTWMMLLLSFPAGLLVSLGHMILGEYFSIGIKTSLVSLSIEWVIYFILGYIQWFKVIPWLINKVKFYLFKKNQGSQ